MARRRLCLIASRWALLCAAAPGLLLGCTTGGRAPEAAAAATEHAPPPPSTPPPPPAPVPPPPPAPPPFTWDGIYGGRSISLAGTTRIDLLIAGGLGGFATPAQRLPPRLPTLERLPTPTTWGYVGGEGLGGRLSLYDVGERIKAAVRRAGFDSWGFYRVPGGFALVTRLERIRADGKPLPPPRRWQTGPRSLLDPQDFGSLKSLLEALRHADAGRYRTIVLHVAPVPPSYGGADVPAPAGGAAFLTADFRAIPFAPPYAVRALVYEMKRPSIGAEARLLPAGASGLDGVGHLREAGIRF
ncbi:MAG: hypothetical protein JOZ90_15255 [Alphaproteobacteria bacterium]|nr:hypothetical protein [Alphaproteobacteria bacterium]MBV9372078.1 hypothetical protein [Alphaproteobacteria bacterium]MBV9902430.1 hypothetical protein [Alphaproteobacteria bacterium]